MTLISNVKSNLKIFQILWSSHNIWTLHTLDFWINMYASLLFLRKKIRYTFFFDSNKSSKSTLLVIFTWIKEKITATRAMLIHQKSKLSMKSQIDYKIVVHTNKVEIVSMWDFNCNFNNVLTSLSADLVLSSSLHRDGTTPGLIKGIHKQRLIW